MAQSACKKHVTRPRALVSRPFPLYSTPQRSVPEVFYCHAATNSSKERPVTVHQRTKGQWSSAMGSARFYSSLERLPAHFCRWFGRLSNAQCAAVAPWQAVQPSREVEWARELLLATLRGVIQKLKSWHVRTP